MYALFLLILLTIIAPIFKIGPIVTRTPNHAKNNVFQVWLPRKTKWNPLAEEAQEVCEWWMGWVCGVILAIIFFIAGSILGLSSLILNLGVIGVAIVGNAIARMITGHFDIVGTEIEVLLCEGSDPLYRQKKIKAMISNTGDQRGMTYEQVEKKLNSWSWLAKIILKIFAKRYK